MTPLLVVPAFRDNYIWILCGAEDDRRRRPAAIVDPGDAAPVLAALDKQGLIPVAILITHHHADHVGGTAELCRRYTLPVYGPAREAIPNMTYPLREGDRVELPGFPPLNVLDVPGHTAGHIAYAGGRLVLCGDTLFAGGCGRLFEGTAAQLYTSLQKLASLPDDTWIYCAHEYTLSNLEFALDVEPDNAALKERLHQTQLLRKAGQPTVPSNLGMEKRTNPFLRCHVPAVAAAAGRQAGRGLAPGVETFSALRRWKDNWQGA